MTNAELKNRFLVGYEFISNNLAPGYTDAEISGFLNQAMDLIVDELYIKQDYANLAEIIEREDFKVQTCIVEEFGSSAYITQPSNTFVDFRWFLNAKAKIKRTLPSPVNEEWIECNLINKLEADKWYQTSINKPIIIYPKIFRYYNPE